MVAGRPHARGEAAADEAASPHADHRRRSRLQHTHSIPEFCVPNMPSTSLYPTKTCGNHPGGGGGNRRRRGRFSSPVELRTLASHLRPERALSRPRGEACGRTAFLALRKERTLWDAACCAEDAEGQPAQHTRSRRGEDEPAGPRTPLEAILTLGLGPTCLI